MDRRQSELMESMLRLNRRVKACDQRIKELEFELAAFGEELIWLSPQLMAARFVCNRAFGYGYGCSLGKAKGLLVGKPQTNLRMLNLESFNLDHTYHMFVDGTYLMPDLFPSSTALALPAPLI